MQVLDFIDLSDLKIFTSHSISSRSNEFVTPSISTYASNATNMWIVNFIDGKHIFSVINPNIILHKQVDPAIHISGFTIHFIKWVLKPLFLINLTILKEALISSDI